MNTSHLKMSISGIVFLITLNACAQNPHYSTYQHKGKEYFHVPYTLTADNIVDVEPISTEQLIADGGQFEILIKKEAFPVRAPNCQANIIARMPWTDQKEKIDSRVTAYNGIKSVLKGEAASTDVVLELNPYVDQDKDGAYLTQCNVFFRVHQGQYINHLGKPTE